MRPTITRAAPGSVEETLEHRVRERCQEWFPDLAGTPEIRRREVGDRPRSTLYMFELERPGESRRVLAKVRKPTSVGPAGPDAGRPRLSADPLPAREQTELEYSGLRRIHRVLGEGRSPFGTVRPLDHLPDSNAILMDWVPGVPLRRVLTARSRMVPARPAPDQRAVWLHAGQWLRAFQAAVPQEGLPRRTATADEVIDMFRLLGDFLSRRLDTPRVRTLAEEGAALAAGTLPSALQVVAGHGDYAPRNALVDDHGRFTVVDPLTRWSVPREEDLCRFLVGIRLVGQQVHSHGLAYGSRWVEDVESEVIRGYFHDEPVPVPQVRCYQLLLLLDKWSALVGNEGGGWAQRLRTRSAVRAGGYLHRQGRRLLELAASGG